MQRHGAYGAMAYGTNESYKHNIRQKTLLWVHLHKVQKHAKLIYGFRIIMARRKEHIGGFLLLDL